MDNLHKLIDSKYKVIINLLNRVILNQHNCLSLLAGYKTIVFFILTLTSFSYQSILKSKAWSRMPNPNFLPNLRMGPMS